MAASLRAMRDSETYLAETRRAGRGIRRSPAGRRGGLVDSQRPLTRGGIDLARLDPALGAEVAKLRRAVHPIRPGLTGRGSTRVVHLPAQQPIGPGL